MKLEQRGLLAAFRRGDAGALRQIYAEFSPRLYRFLVRLGARVDLAEDLHQETWIAAARHAPRLVDDTDLAAWLYTIARNKYRSWWRWSVRSLEARLRARAPEPVGPDPVPALVLRHDLARALAALPPIHREVLLLVGCEGLDHAQAAAVLGLREGALRQRLLRARAALAERLEAQNLDEDAAAPTRKVQG